MKKMATFIGAGLIATSLALAGPAIADTGTSTSSAGISDVSSSTTFTAPASASDFASHLASELGSVPWCGSCGFWVTGAQSPVV